MTWIHWVYLLGIPVSYVFALAFTKATEGNVIFFAEYIGMFIVSLIWPVAVAFILISFPVKRASDELAKWMEGIMK